MRLDEISATACGSRIAGYAPGGSSRAPRESKAFFTAMPAASLQSMLCAIFELSAA
jgi:hypothetical protein